MKKSTWKKTIESRCYWALEWSRKYVNQGVAEAAQSVLAMLEDKADAHEIVGSKDYAVVLRVWHK